jgi:nitrite reductase (NO-forming)
VAIVQAQARRALAVAAGFAVAAAAASVVPHRTGAWLPLHLFLVGTLLSAISGATRLFAVTWSAGTPGHPVEVAVQRWAVAVGAAGLAAGRELRWPAGVLGLAGSLVVVGLLLLGHLLVVEVRSGKVPRFRPALHAYLAAIACGLAGAGLGVAMVAGRGAERDAHVVLNVLGLVGLVMAGTLPFFVATQARMKMSPRATLRRLHVTLALLAGGVGIAAAGALTEHPAVTGAGLAAYVGGLVHLATTLPSPGAKQLRWAGPRLLQLALGLAWWAGTVAVAAVRSFLGLAPLPESLVVTLVVGAYAQILVASLAYLGPVLRGGGHERLGRGFATTRSWVAVVTVNGAGLAWLLQWHWIAVALVVATAVDLVVRGERLVLDRV